VEVSVLKMLIPSLLNTTNPGVVGQFEYNAILKGCELIAVGERCDTHGTRSDLILTLKGSHLAV
jgi:hypothetical protein